MEELLKKAEALGINPEGLTQKQLEKAIATAEKQAVKIADYKAREEKLGLEVDGLDDVDLINRVEEAEDAAEAAALQAEIDATNAAKLELLVKHAGVEDFDSLSPEDLEKVLAGKAADAAAKATVVAEEVKVVEGKSDKAFKAKGGKEYVFVKDAPAAFRYMGKRQTQEEWMSDKDSMQIMVDSKLNYLTQKK